MLFKATVPNTYAAAVASRAVWSKAKAVSAAPAAPTSYLRCECGNLLPLDRKTPYDACDQCVAIDRSRIDRDDRGEVAQTILALFKPGVPLTLTEIVEAFAYKKPRYTLGKVLRQLHFDGKLARAKRVCAYGYAYTLKGGAP